MRIVGANGTAQSAADYALSQGASAADASTYGMASEALSQGQTLWAWGQMAQAQNAPQMQYTSTEYGPIACPAGYLLQQGGDNVWKATCVAPNGIRVTPYFLRYCDKPVDMSAGGLGAWWSCDLLVLYMQQTYGNIFDGKSWPKWLAASQPMLESLRALGAFQEGQWERVKTSVRALAHALTHNYHYEDSFPQAVDVLTTVAAKAYDAEKVPAPKISLPKLENPASLSGNRSSLPTLLLGGAAVAVVAALAVLRPGLAMTAYRTASGAASGAVSGARRLARRIL